MTTQQLLSFELLNRSHHLSPLFNLILLFNFFNSHLTTYNALFHGQLYFLNIVVCVERLILFLIYSIFMFCCAVFYLYFFLSATNDFVNLPKPAHPQIAMR